MALGLTAALLLPGAALAVEPSSRQEDLNFLYETLKEGHPNLFANTSEADFLARKAEIEQDLEEGSDFDFACTLQTLVVLAGDSHTSLNLGQAGKDIHILPMAFTEYEGKWILSTVLSEHRQQLGGQVTAVNGVPMEELINRFRVLISADNDVWLHRQFKQLCYVQEILEWLGVAKAGQAVTLSIIAPDGKAGEIALTALSAEEQKSSTMDSLKASRVSVPATDPDKTRAYFSLALDETTYYIQYNRCQNDPDLPMKDFAAQVKAELDKGAYTKVLVDLRNNGGGSDGVIFPLLEVLAEGRQNRGTKIFCLTGEATFSSACINAAMLKELGAVLAGGPTGGGMDHFGAVDSFALPNSQLKVGHSTKFIDMETLLAAGAGYGVEPVRPDLTVAQTLADYQAGRDTLVETIRSTGDTWVMPENAAMANTRGGFVERLWEAAKAAGATREGAGASSFEDIFPVASYLPALEWAEEEGLVLGSGQGQFRPFDTITQAERSLILERFLAWSESNLAPGKGLEIVTEFSD